MKITVEHYDEKVSIETEHDDVSFQDFMDLIQRISYGVGYHEETINEWFTRIMNIFYLHPDPAKAASFFYDKHKVKMILESAQMLCTAHHVYNNGDNVPYKKAHLNHPSTIWVRDSIHHYNWLYDHMLALGREYYNAVQQTSP